MFNVNFARIDDSTRIESNKTLYVFQNVPNQNKIVVKHNRADVDLYNTKIAIDLIPSSQ